MRGTIQDELQAITVTGPSGGSVTCRPQQLLAYVVDRVRFDRKLAERAARSGARVLAGAGARVCAARLRL